MFEQTGGVVKALPVPKAVPPFGNKYQLYVPALAEEAVNAAVAPNATVAVAGLTLGGAGDGFTTTVCTPVYVVPFFTMETIPVVPGPAKPSICVAEIILNADTGVPPILTADTPVKFVPVIVKVPELAHTMSGATLVIVGANPAQA